MAPGEQPVAAENNSVAFGGRVDGVPQHHCKFEAGTLPRKPDQGMTILMIKLFHFLAAVGCGSEGDTPVRMEVVDVFEWKKRVEWRVDRSRDAVVTESAEWIHADHLVFSADTSVLPAESKYFIQI